MSSDRLKVFFQYEDIAGKWLYV